MVQYFTNSYTVSTKDLKRNDVIKLTPNGDPVVVINVVKQDPYAYVIYFLNIDTLTQKVMESPQSAIYYQQSSQRIGRYEGG